MTRKTVNFNNKGALKLPVDKPVIYKIQTESGKTNYVGIAKRGRAQERNVHPKIWVISPELEKRSDQNRIPHTYSGNRLCLFLPGTGEWSRDKLIADTIIPWASLWLYYYEVWHATGDWLGGGVHLLENKDDKEKGDNAKEGFIN